MHVITSFDIYSFSDKPLKLKYKISSTNKTKIWQNNWLNKAPVGFMLPYLQIIDVLC